MEGKIGSVDLASEALDLLQARAGSVSVLVVGDLMLDHYLVGGVSRVSPEAPVPVVQVTGEYFCLGGAANVAANLRALGVECGVIGVVGQDESGDRLLGTCSDLGISTDRVIRCADRPTTAKTRVMARNHHLVRLDRENPADVVGMEGELLGEAVRVAASGFDVMVLQDYNKGVLSRSLISECISVANGVGIPVVVDPKKRNFSAYGGATVFKPNRVEFEAYVGADFDPDAEGALRDYRQALGCDHLLVTLGEAGMIGSSGSGDTVRVPAFAREVFDVSGAGDTVTAAIAAMLAVGATFESSLWIAAHAAAVAVGRSGAQAVDVESVRSHVRAHRDGSPGSPSTA